VRIDILRRVERALTSVTLRYIEAHATLYPEIGARYAPVAGGFVCFTGIDSPLSKGTGMGLDIDGFLAHKSPGTVPVDEEDIRTAEEFLQRRGARPRFDSSPARHESLKTSLENRGYTIDYLLNLYCLDLEASREQPRNAGGQAAIFVITLNQENPEHDHIWSLTVGRGFANSSDSHPPYIDIYRTIFRAKGTTPFLALVRGVPAGAGALKVSGEVGILSTASTIPAFRKMGVQSALLEARLHAAREMGCKIAAVQATPGGTSERNITRAGFSPVAVMADWAKE
jgi:GNAT superfamily N-acetyltransferase